MKKALAAAINACVAAAQPVPAFLALVSSEPHFLRAALRGAPSAVLLGAGKASVGLVAELVAQLRALEVPCAGGVVVTKDGHSDPASSALLASAGIAVHEASHPVPDSRGVAGARAMLDCARCAPRMQL